MTRKGRFSKEKEASGVSGKEIKSYFLFLGLK